MESVYALLFLAIIASTVIYLYKWIKKFLADYSRFSQQMDLIPGPLALPIFGNALGFILRPRNQYLDEITGIVKLHHPFFRLWNGPFMGTIHITSWKYAETIFNSSTHIEKNLFYKFLNPWLGTGLLTSKGEKWHSRRKLLTPAFHRSVLDGYQEVVCEKSEQLVQKLSSIGCGTEAFNIAPLIWQCSLDIICETAMGTKMNIQKKLEEKDAAYLAAVGEASGIIINRCVRPWIHPDIIFNLTPMGRRFNRSVKIMHDFTNKVIRTRKAEYFRTLEAKSKIGNYEDETKNKKRKAFLDILIEAAYSESHGSKPILSDEDIREEVDTFMFEGHDTTASAISWALYLLGHHPDIQEKVVQEIDDVLGDDMDITSQKLSELKLLERCIKESLRLYPSVPFIARKLREDVKLGKYTVPSETEVFILIYFMHRDPDTYSNPEKFNPDNFLPEVCEKRHPYAYVPFSAGARNCIGQKFALIEEKTVLSYILKKYRIESVDDPKDIKLLMDIIIRSENGINLRLYPRTPRIS